MSGGCLAFPMKKKLEESEGKAREMEGMIQDLVGFEWQEMERGVGGRVE